MSKLDALKKMTTVVADTGEIQAIAQYKPRDATTNPSLLLKAAQMPEYRGLVDEALKYANQRGTGEGGRRSAFLDKLAVNFGVEILKLVPGRVSTEVDAALSFDARRSIEKARHLVGLYEAAGVPRERVLIKVGSTWEGIRAAELLEKDGIHCNLTLLFSFAQAVACAEAGVTLISPFVGRIYDWHKKARNVPDIPIAEDPGVESVRRIYTYYKKFDYKTQVMGASFRKAEQIVELAGVDLLTISPELLEQLAAASGDVERRLDPAKAKAADVRQMHLDEPTFRFLHNEDAMGTEKLAEGIRTFYADARKLEQFAKTLMAR